MKIVYVAGPYRGRDNWEITQNCNRSEALALEVWRRGFAAISPHMNTRNFQGAAPDDVWLKGDLEILSRCDAVLLIEGWQRSSGTKAEIAFAVEKRIPVFETLADLEAHWSK